MLRLVHLFVRVYEYDVDILLLNASTDRVGCWYEGGAEDSYFLIICGFGYPHQLPEMGCWSPPASRDSRHISWMRSASVATVGVARLLLTPCHDWPSQQLLSTCVCCRDVLMLFGDVHPVACSVMASHDVSEMLDLRT